MLDGYHMTDTMTGMAKKKAVSVTIDATLLAEAKRRVGEGGFSQLVEEALELRLQHDRLADLERWLTEQYGPIPDDVRARVDAIPWPE